MRRASRIAGLSLAVITLVIVAYTASAENPALDFTLVNKTGYTIKELFISPSNTNSWGEDILGRDTLANGEKCKITFSSSESSELWDMKVTWSDGDSPDVWHQVDLTKYHTITVFYNRGEDKTWAEGE